jgi:putative tricarboxylic transport membrane protein
VKKANIVCGLIGMAFSATAFVQTLSFRQFRNVPIGPDFVPRYLAGALFICSLVLFIQSIVLKPKSAEKAPTLSLFDKGMQRLLIGIVIIVVYALCWEILGFLIITPFAMAAVMLLLGMRKPLTMVLFSVGTTVVVYGAFRYILSIDIPLGVLRGLIY